MAVVSLLVADLDEVGVCANVEVSAGVGRAEEAVELSVHEERHLELGQKLERLKVAAYLSTQDGAEYVAHGR